MSIRDEKREQKPIKKEQIRKWRNSFQKDTKSQIIMNALTKNSIQDIAMNWQVNSTIDHTYSHEIETMEKVTNQEKSGRCWIFAGLNILRIATGKKLNLKNFEFSQSYLMFWDKLEKSNYFLENIIDTRGKDIRDRTVMWLLDTPIGDGGQWDMFVDLVKKYGVLPKSVANESYNSSNSNFMNRIISGKLREDAFKLRRLYQKGKDEEFLRDEKEKMMEEIYRMLCLNLGEQPDKFSWGYRDKDKNFKRIENVTPQDFYEKYVPVDLENMITLINAPMCDKEYMKLYTVKYLGNVHGKRVIYMNLEVEQLKEYALKTIKNDEPVWFGCDVGKLYNRDKGIMDTSLYDYEGVFDTQFTLDKGGRLDYGDSRLTHAMVLSGVDVEKGKTKKWKVENSWGKDVGEKGYFIMTDGWFDQYVFEVAINKEYFAQELIDLLKTEPVVLPPWDPMGAVAKLY
jgi:bleomycin hydrolase